MSAKPYNFRLFFSTCLCVKLLQRDSKKVYFTTFPELVGKYQI